MKKKYNYKSRAFKRLVCLTLAFTLVFTGVPLDIISEDITEQIGIMMNAMADDVLESLKEKYSGTNHTFTSGTPDLSEYSLCFQDSSWAATHYNDTITLNPAAGTFVFDSNYNPIGNASAAFEGTFILNTTVDDFAVVTNSPIFDYVKDSVKIQRNGDLVKIPLKITRDSDVGSTVSPLMANHVVGSGASSPYEWKVILSSVNAKSYSGVIYEMAQSAKVNLTFTDNSSHTPQLDNNNNITSGSIIDNKESGKNYGILCGSVKGGSVLQCTYTNTNDDKVTFIGTGTAECGGLIGEINNSTFELLSGSSELKVDFETAKDQVGFICGHAEGSTITLPTDYAFSGTIDGNVYAGGIAGYCKNTIINYGTASDDITLSNCEIKNGNNATATGGVFGYYESDTVANDILLSRKYELSDCTIVSGKGYSGGIAGDYKSAYSTAATIDIDKYTLDSSISLSGTTAGGLFGRYTAGGSVTITDYDTTNDHFVPPVSSVPYGGIIGEYSNNNTYANTLSLSGFTVDSLNCTSNKNVGGVISTLKDSAYVSVSDVSVTNVTVNIGNTAPYFGGIVSKLDDTNAGSFIDLTGDFTLSMSSGITYKGGAIAASFTKGVIRFAGLTDISGAQAESGYAQLVYDNDETLVYALGNGNTHTPAVIDQETGTVTTPASGWQLKRNADTTASDLGQWGEVVRMIGSNNLETAGIVTLGTGDNAHKVKVAQGVKAISSPADFAKCALNMQLNDGFDHGALCFAEKSTYNSSELLKARITISGKIDLTGTGLLGLMRDGGNDKYLDSSDNSFKGSVEFFTGKVTGSNSAEIVMAAGETYGTYKTGKTGTGGKIYLTVPYGHDAQGLFAFAKGATITDLKVSGEINVERKQGSSDLYAGALFGAITNGANLSGVNIATTLNITRANEAKFYIGGIAGVFDGTDTTNSAGYTLTIDTRSSIKPIINLYGVIASDSDYTKNNSYVGGVLGLLKGSANTKYSVSIASSEVSPTISIDNDVADANLSYLGGMIGRVAKNESNSRSISLNAVTMTGASVDTKAKYAGGLLGAMWERTNLTVDGLTITGSTVNHKYSGTGSKQSGLVFMGTGKWDINSLTIQANSSSVNTSFNSTDAAPVSFGLIVNEAYSGDDGLYLNLLNRGYTLSGVTVPVSSTNTDYYVDEIAADTSSGDILAGGNGTGIININMNAANGTKTKITDVSGTTENGTGTYQNQLYSQLNPNDDDEEEEKVYLTGNRNSRYYYNLDVMLAKGSSAPAGEQFLLWSVYNYAAANIKGNFKSDGDMITGTSIDLSGLSYYPIPGGSITLPENATVTFGYNAIHDYEDRTIEPDNWKRFPDDVGAPKSDSARNQHYLMQTGLFTTVSSLSANTLTLAGDFGYVSGVASGALINNSTSGSVTLTGLTLDGLAPSSAASYMLINQIDGTGTATPSLIVSNLRATNYSSGLPVAKSLFGTATGKNMTVTFSDIMLDARNGDTITDSKWTESAAAAMTTAYGTSRSIFSDAIFFTELWAAKTCNMEYNYPVEKDWGTESNPREVTYGKEVTDSKEYENSEKHYYLAGESDGNCTNPVSNSNEEFNFAAGFLPYVGNYTSKGTNTDYPVNEIKVNYKAPGITVGCGTYNDPYIISDPGQLNTVAKAINGTDYPGTIRLPNYIFADHVWISWHDSTVNPNGCGLYNKITNESTNTTTYDKATSNTKGISSSSSSAWTPNRVRYYLASAYYKIEGSWILPDDFEGLGVPNDSANTYKGNTVFHGVIVGDSTSKPTITNPTDNPLIVVANGAVIKNININNTGTITREQTETQGNALYGYNGTNTDAKYYGGVIGEIMGGDNIIDDVTVTYSGKTTLSGSAAHLIAEGGMVGCVVNGALIFRGSNTVSGRSASGGGIYSNPVVGRVINGYAIYESISGRTGTAPANSSNYHIDTIVRNNTKLDVNYEESTITVPDAQSLYIMSLITQSIASTANTDTNTQYGAYSPSYGYNGYITGVARLGDYTDVGCGSAESAADHTDYSSLAYLDSVNNYTNASSKDGLLKAPVPYIIYRYTARKSTTATNPAADFPARMMTSDNNKFWDITLSSSSTFASMDSFAAFRGIGCVGINAYRTDNNASKTAFKVATFDGGGNVINLHISLPRYERNQENYFHYQNKSLTQSYSGDELTSPYGHDQNLVKLMGLGLFDCVMVSYDSDHEYQFKNFTLKGTIEDKVYNSSGIDITGTTDNSQLFCVGGVVGKRINGNNSNLNFYTIIFDGLTITGAYSCGGLIGIDAIGNKGTTADNNAKKSMEINGCNSTSNGISITGGYFGGDTNIRHGIGSFVGMTFWCRPYIDGKTDTSDTSDITVSKVTTFYEGDKGCSVGGLIGYTGSGAEIKNINLVAANSNAVIGGVKASNVGGFIGFTQAMTEDKTNNRSTPNANDLKDCVYIENCTIQGLPIKAKNGVGGFVAKTGNSNTWHTKYVYISDCAVIGNSESKPEIKAYGTGETTQTNYAGGFVGDLRSSVVTCLIQNSYIENYTIEGWHVGGIIGETTYRSANLRNLYVKDCEIIRNNASSGSIGGIVGYSNQNLNGYNLKIDNVIFKKKNGSSYNESPSDAGFILGESNGKKENKFVAIGAYNSDVSKVPAAVVKTNGTNTSNFFVFADYLNTSAADITNKAGYASSFGVTSSNTVADTDNNLPYPSAPYVNTAPHMSVGTGENLEYLTGDGASIGKAGDIYKDIKAGSSNRRYTIGTNTDPSFASTEKNDSTVLAKYINNDGSYKTGTFKISTAAAELGTLPEGMENFAMLVIDDDSEKSNDITPFIKSYIRLVTNAEGSSNGLINNQYAYSCGSTANANNIDALYKVVVRPCYYSESAGEFVLGTEGAQGLQLYSGSDTDAGKYYFDSTKADSESDNPKQFSLIDVQFKDPTDTTHTKIAYHLYVPVYTKKMLTAEFSAVTMSGTNYYRTPYANKIASEMAAGKNATGYDSILVESTNEWTTTFIRYTYPKDQISASDDWNFAKRITLYLDGNFQTLPSGTKLILVDPNANSDKFYTLTLNGTYSTGTDITLELSSFTDEAGAQFTPQNLSAILADPGASNTAEGHTNELYEDYYISMYVPKVEGNTHSVHFGSKGISQMTYTVEGETHKVNIDPKLYSLVILGDLFNHRITANSFMVNSGDGTSWVADNREMNATNDALKTEVTATVQIKNQNAGSYLANSDVYHAFYISLTSHYENGRVSDIINGINPEYVHNTTTISYVDSEGSHTATLKRAHLDANFIRLDSGSIRDALSDPTMTPEITIHSVTTMEFYDTTAFPYNVNEADKIGTQVSVKSNLAYRQEDLRYSALNVIENDLEGKFYYSTTKNNAQLSFNAVPTDDATDNVGYKTNNRSLLGVNGKYGTAHPIVGKAIYNVDDIVDYNSANSVVYKITLYKKETDSTGTRYVKVDDISKYMSNVYLTDSNSEVTLTPDRSDHQEYVYTGLISHSNPLDLDKMFEVDFRCTVLTGDTTHNEYANYKIVLTADLDGAANAYKDAFLIYTNAKFDPSVIDE